MKRITEVKLKSAVTLKPAEMNRIHFGGNHTPLTPEQIKGLIGKKIAGDSTGEEKKIEGNG